MPMPKSVVRINKSGIKFISNVDRAQYTIRELSRAALRDSAKLLRKRMIEQLKKLPGMKRNKRLYTSTQYWVRKKETDLQIGVKHGTWYGEQQELGTHNQPARHIVRNTAFDNIDTIRVIQGKYLSAIENENVARGLISEDEATGSERDDQ